MILEIIMSLQIVFTFESLAESISTKKNQQMLLVFFTKLIIISRAKISKLPGSNVLSTAAPT